MANVERGMNYSVDKSSVITVTWKRLSNTYLGRELRSMAQLKDTIFDTNYKCSKTLNNCDSLYYTSETYIVQQLYFSRNTKAFEHLP